MTMKKYRRQKSSPLDGFDAFLAARLKDWNVPGTAVGIVRDGRIIHARGYGFRDIRHKLPVTAETSFAIGSCTKSFTAMAMGILVDDGKMGWDTPVREYVPSFAVHDPIATQLMTAQDLLTHRSGLPRHDMVWVNTPFDRNALFHKLRHLEPTRSFRGGYQYNNLMYMAAGVMVEKLAGCSWETFIKKRILQPLGMNSVTFSNTEMAALSDRSLGYDRRGRRTVRVPHENVTPVGPAGAMNANIVDLCRWVTFQLNGEGPPGKRLLTRKTLKNIHSPHVTFTEDDDLKELLDPSYALGWIVQPYRGHRRLTHGGCVDGFNANISFMPDHNMGVAVLTNVTASPLTRIIPYTIYDRLLGLKPIDWSARFREIERQARVKKQREAGRTRAQQRRGTRPSHSLATYAGQYEHPAYGSLIIKVNGRKLHSLYNNVVRPLAHFHFEQFEMISRGTWPWRKRVTFHTGLNGKIVSVAVAFQEGADDIVFIRT